jgi:putative flippase GtrA
MTLLPPRISDALWRIVPAPLENRLRSTVVKRFVRFAPAAVCAVAATQITYIICLGPANLTAGISGFLGWLAGATVSYVISRWAWERKGRPHLLKETLPFIAVSISAGIILTLASKLGNQVAASMGFHDGPGQVIVADAFYFAANCLTFAGRFLIFHYVLFADRKWPSQPRRPRPGQTGRHRRPASRTAPRSNRPWSRRGPTACPPGPMARPSGPAPSAASGTRASSGIPAPVIKARAQDPRLPPEIGTSN